MTRDTQGLHDDRELENDADVYGALWTATPFPRLPIDAPNELKNLTIDVDDPKRVYAIHRASRRHNFNILVEKSVTLLSCLPRSLSADRFARYILQLRYGCQSKTCTTPTCFSCRKRLARGAPVRRYNATSARTLAIYLASQDNPEQGLCRNPVVDLPYPPINKHPKVTAQRSPPNEISDISNPQAVPHLGRNGADPGSKTLRLFKTTSRRDGDDNQVETNTGPRKGKSQKVGSVMKGMEEPRPTDHRSFVQNVFGTVAFKMVEWLTPRNLEIMAISGDTTLGGPERDGTISNPSPAAVHKDIEVEEKDGGKKSGFTETVPSNETNAREKKPPLRSSKNPPTPVVAIPTTGEITATRLPDSKPNSNSTATYPATPSVRRRTTEIGDPPNPKGILSISPKKDSPPDIQPLSREMLPTQPKRRLSQQTIITSPQLHVSEPQMSQESKISPDEAIPEQRPSVSVANVGGETETSDSREPRDNERESEEIASSASTPVSPKEFALPQSLSRLSIEVIELVCDILQTDDTAEKHFLQPPRIYESLKRRQSNTFILKRRPSPQTSSGYQSALRSQWHSFIEQGFFDVLCKPDSLLRSFSNDEKRLFDTQTIWYLMLRMTRVAPSLVFDSLWNVAGTLFLPPAKLESKYDWAKESQSQKAIFNKSVSNYDAAQVLNICLQALVAAAPLVTDAGQLANLSRIRSDGLIFRSKDSSAVESAELCLQYEDAFSDEMALRLARRVFAAIPTRRRYGELLDLHSIRSEEKPERDVLEIVLATFKSLDLGTPPMLNFPDSERDFHEKRVPTLILDWARTVLLQGWEGSAEIPTDGPLGGALAMIAAICELLPRA
jgi:hypothetical protein